MNERFASKRGEHNMTAYIYTRHTFATSNRK